VKVPSRYAVGAASHTGAVRSNNEDDYLLGALHEAAPPLLLAAVADGMGGAAGGAEASRAALRALGATVLDAQSRTPVLQRLQDGFQAASARVCEQAAAVPALAGMGTTLTALCLAGDEAWVGHVGDTRLYRLRGGACELLTTDHAVRHPDNLLLRCIGGGQAACEADHLTLSVQPGDRFVLLSDGVWSVVTEADLVQLARSPAPQQAAAALVAQALAAGGPDNATALVVEVGPTDGGPPIDVELPREERSEPGRGWPSPVSLRAPWWPWLLLTVAMALTALVVLRVGFGIDGWVWLRSHW
jgi:protein phosphatase